MKRFGTVIVTLILLLTMFLPMLVIHLYGVKVDLTSDHAPGGVAVGLIVILRAAARRLLRGLSFNIMQTTIGTFGRTSARTLTRRFMRFVSRVLFGSILQDSIDEDENGVPKKKKVAGPLKQIFSLFLGFAGLCLSFWGILHVVSPDIVEALIGSRGLSHWEAVILAGVPLLAYALLHKLFSKRLGVRIEYCTEIDGLILQGYFTGAGSFLPMTTDIEYYGESKANCKLAVRALVGMFIISVSLFVLGEVLSMPSLDFLGCMFLVYCFVYSFPIEPLEGHIIWSQSKLLWVAIALPILLVFMNFMDNAFGDIL